MSGFEQLPDGVYRWLDGFILQSTFRLPDGWEWYNFETDTWSSDDYTVDCPLRVRPAVEPNLAGVWVIVEVTEFHDEDRDPDLPDERPVERLYDTVYGTQADMEHMAHMLNGMNPQPEAWQSDDGTRGYWPKSTIYCEAREIVPVPEDYTL